MAQRPGLHDPLLDELVEGKEIGRSVVLELASSLCWIVLEGCDSYLEPFVTWFKNSTVSVPTRSSRNRNNLLYSETSLRVNILHYFA